MTLKWIGAFLIFTGCGGFGFSMAAAFRREERDLHQLRQALEYMSCELSYRMTPLPQLCRNAANSVTGQIRVILNDLAICLEQQLAPDVSDCMDKVLANHPTTPKIEMILKDLGRTLGRFDLPGQLRGLDASIHGAQSAIRDHRENRTNRIRSYQTLSLCAGAALAILFL